MKKLLSIASLVILSVAAGNVLNAETCPNEPNGVEGKCFLYYTGQVGNDYECDTLHPWDIYNCKDIPFQT